MMKTALLSLCLALCVLCAARGEVSLSPMFSEGAVRDTDRGAPRITGRAAPGSPVYVRVTGASDGRSVTMTLRADEDGVFSGTFAAGTDVYFIDAAEDPDFADAAEGALICRRGAEAPELPSVFTNDLLDRKGNRDRKAREYPAVRRLLSLYINSRGAAASQRGDRKGFDTDNDEDLAYFKRDLALYDFAHRDRDWSRPLGRRPCRCFWQSVWPSWFNSSNDHPLDGDPDNGAFGNYMPYAFANDFADILIMYAMRLGRIKKPFDDNLRDMVRQGAANLAAMQHLQEGNLALEDHRGVRERYTRGAFHYGMFVNGDYLTEGKGWFYNPAFLDYAGGGVLNGRALWGLCEAAAADPGLRESLVPAIGAGLQFCLCDGYEGGYTRSSSGGRPYWRDPGEHAYLTLGLAETLDFAGKAAAYVDKKGRRVSFGEACRDSLNALCDLQRGRSWSRYPNVDSMAIAALARGCLALPGDPDAGRWRDCAAAAADYWLSLWVRRSEYRGEVINFGLNLVPGEMTYCWGRADDSWKARGQFFYYQTGHWLQALALLYRVTGEAGYLLRCRRMTAYLLGDNPLRIRILNETGGVYNWTEDTDGDGLEDRAMNNMYPESTAYCQIGIMHYLDLPEQ
ncbi:MAG: hypothetical protein IK083_00745 [Abditibacteriota bacterium]|nr:hypothetical protein [Abditibacteriota bacterium]